MRYVVIKKENSSPQAVIWTKSQHAIEIKPNITRECSHRDYLRKNNIPFTDVSSIGMVYCDPQTGKQEISVLPWDTPAPEEDSALVQNEATSFCENNPDLKNEIQADWNEYKAWQKKAMEFAANRK